jgi:hypothetical protein
MHFDTHKLRSNSLKQKNIEMVWNWQLYNLGYIQVIQQVD